MLLCIIVYIVPAGEASDEGLFVPLARGQHVCAVVNAEHGHLLRILEVLQQLRAQKERWTRWTGTTSHILHVSQQYPVNN